MTPYSLSCYRSNISVYQMKVIGRRTLKALVMLPKRKEKQRTQNACRLSHPCRHLASSRRFTLPCSCCQSDGRACCSRKLAWKCSRGEQKHILSDSRTHKSPLPPSGNKVDFKTSIPISNDKIVYLGNWKKTRKSFCLKQRSPFSKDTDIIKNISFRSRDRLQLDFLYPLADTEATDRNLCLARKWPDNLLQLDCHD